MTDGSIVNQHSNLASNLITVSLALFLPEEMLNWNPDTFLVNSVKN